MYAILLPADRKFVRGINIGLPGKDTESIYYLPIFIDPMIKNNGIS